MRTLSYLFLWYVSALHRETFTNTLNVSYALLQALDIQKNKSLLTRHEYNHKKLQGFFFLQ